jgi:Histidine kinase-, DNA gyrase B-, and HSP90-like ATPase
MAQSKKSLLRIRRPPAKRASDDGSTGSSGSLADPLVGQRRYVAKCRGRKGGLGFVFAEAFIRGMREIGYKNPAWALAELIDNSLQAGATTVDIRMKDVDWTKALSKPSQIAVIDNGIGMIDEMISHAVRWGGTERENDRSGFGRYGYGLPSAAVSLARQYSVYSRIEGGEWYVVRVNLDALGMAAGDTEGVDALLEAVVATPPTWLKSVDGKRDVADLPSGTIVVLEDLDRLHQITGWISAKALQIKLLQQFGVIYRHTLHNKRIFVAGERTQVTDPLFLLPQARFADETDIKAKPVLATAFEMDGLAGSGVVRIRAAVLPPNFQLANPGEYSNKGAKNAQRWKIMSENNGILVCRAGRQIDVVSPEWTKFQTYDANIKIEIDFDPTLDEFFGLTTSKQQIVIDERMWEKLKQSGRSSGGLQTLIKEMRRDFRQLQSKLKAGRPSGDDKAKARASALAMEAAQKFKPRSFLSPQKSALAEKALEEYAQTLSRSRGISIEEASAAAKTETEGRRFEIEFAALEEAPMYLARRLGLQKRLIINTAHPFFEKIYEIAGEAQAELEVLLFVLADAELDADGEREDFYRNERPLWSEGLRHALEQLISDQEVANRASSAAEED